MLDLLKSVNDSMHQIAITGYEVWSHRGDCVTVKSLSSVNANALPSFGRVTSVSWDAC